MNVILLTKNVPGREDTFEHLDAMDGLSDLDEAPDDAEGYSLRLTDQQLRNFIQVAQAALDDPE